MKDFEYAAPVTLAEATALLARHNGTARVLAGGTDLLVQLRERLRDADLVVDIKRIPEITQFSYSDETGLRLGAAVPCYQIYDNHELCAAYPALADSTHIVGGWQIQSRASVGGNLCNSSPAGDTLAPRATPRGRNSRCLCPDPRVAREARHDFLAWCRAFGFTTSLHSQN